jgi:transcription elongation GreA/GreB family factor
VKIVRIFPEALELVEERQEVVAKKPLDRLTSYRSMKERHEELEEIVNKKIPENSAAIAHARSYGDLRENAEYKAAKDNQRYLMARRKELEHDLKEVLPTDFVEVVVSETVVPGCTVDLTHPSGKVQTFHVLGLWDSQPEQHIISYDTPLGRALVGQKLGNTIELPEGGTATVSGLRALTAELLQWVKAPE